MAVLESTITCPRCGSVATEVMPLDRCMFFWECPACHAIMKPKAGDCCVYCSYGTVPCPSIQDDRQCPSPRPSPSAAPVQVPRGDTAHFLTTELLDPGPNGARLWRLRFGGSVVEAYLSDVGHWGVAYRRYLNGRFIYSERFATEDEARHAATDALERLLQDGWVVEDVSARKTA